MRVLHVLHHSVPYMDGYSIRSSAIVNFQRAMGLDPVVVTSGHHEIEVGRRSAAATIPDEEVRGTVYHRTPLPATGLRARALTVPVLRERTLMRSLGASIERTLRETRVDLIHSHSPVLCGRPALDAARRHGLPFVYEVRAIWEDALLSPAPTWINRRKYAYSRGLETAVLQAADGVVGISRHLVDEIADRGVARSRLHVMPNGVDTDRFVPADRDAALADSLGLTGRPVVGFIGSFFKFEGLDCLLQAMVRVRAEQPEARLVLVGTGEVDAEVRALIRSLGLEGVALQLGRVPHEEILRYYSIMDVLVYPRHRDRITELVTPLKPLEAFAVGRAVVGSDVGGIRELLADGRVGRLFKAGDAGDLAQAVTALLADPAERERLAQAGRAYVVAERRWDALVSTYRDIYARAIQTHAARASRAGS